jgi:4-hydroxy-3-polyprenylbenzoate decarboxylase
MVLIIGISGASGAIYGIRLLEVLSQLEGVETHLVISKAGEVTIREETDWKLEEVKKLANFWYNIEDVGARISSGSFKKDGMVVAPCSMKTLSAIANSYTDNLLTRAADVTLKEGRKLILLVRETPLHLGHLRNMGRAAEIGAIIMPPIPAFYHQPHTIQDLVDHTVGKVLDLLGLEHSLFPRWSGLHGEEAREQRD